MAIYEVVVRMEIREAFMVRADNEEEARYRACCRASGFVNDVIDVRDEAVVRLDEPAEAI
jgi:hypothetical protein